MKNNIKVIKIKLKLLLILILILLTYPVLGAETVSKTNYADPIVKVNNAIYIFNESLIILEGGERVVIFYEIRPKTDEDAKIIDNRYYFIRTQLHDPKLKIEVSHKKGGTIVYKYEDNEVALKIDDLDALDGLQSIVINLTGTIPTVLNRIVKMTIMEIIVQDSEGDPLCPVVVVVVNSSKFMEDIKALKDRLKKLKSEATMLNILNPYIKFASNNITLAESYFKDGEFIKADKCLNYVETNLVKAEFEIEKAKAMRKYEEVKKRIDELESLINKTGYLVQNAKEKGKNVAIYDLELSKIRIRYEHIIKNVIDIENYLESGKFNEAIKLANHTLEEVNSVIYNLTKISSDLENLISENKIKNNYGIIKNYYPIMGVILGIIILFVVIGKIRKRRKWDELR